MQLRVRGEKATAREEQRRGGMKEQRRRGGMKEQSPTPRKRVSDPQYNAGARGPPGFQSAAKVGWGVRTMAMGIGRGAGRDGTGRAGGEHGEGWGGNTGIPGVGVSPGVPALPRGEPGRGAAGDGACLGLFTWRGEKKINM